MDTSTSPDSSADFQLARLAGAIAEPARARMLGCLMDGHARTATELATVAEVAASTASAHLARLKDERLVELLVQGKHRYFRLASDEVAAALESLMVLAGAPRAPSGQSAPSTASFVPSTPSRLRSARTCYDHMAGTAGVALHDRLHAQGWLSGLHSGSYELTPDGAIALESLGVEVDAVRRSRRRFACACLDWSERRPHLGGALGAAWLQLSLRRGWVRQELDGRALVLTPKAQREMPELFA
ncbi:helix-turn-helix transcriptional regulator [Variovorax sp. J22G73]|uniref:ArsR/SmtB family transcription factor n=1 Tax=unclassified Variovorax TaxID=663243 RepID=UPI002577ADF1|nr:MULTISPECIES: helix-turn-helix transcriptional regulator [unclassified Variovorax]MDM0009921.1 helix-turn-helix transcriptional regulator [Variovorax sp. J22R203]MDM0102429.1 helix-turn-helix transcriptional regulator [Variovorax sp. J22G73]